MYIRSHGARGKLAGVTNDTQWVSPYCPTQTGSEAFLLVLQDKNIDTYTIKKVLKLSYWLPHFRTFCELVEGEGNELTTFSTWTIMLGCNESNIIFQQHLCKLGQLRRNSQVLGQAMKKRPTGQVCRDAAGK